MILSILIEDNPLEMAYLTVTGGFKRTLLKATVMGSTQRPHVDWDAGRLPFDTKEVCHVMTLVRMTFL